MFATLSELPDPSNSSTSEDGIAEIFVVAIGDGRQLALNPVPGGVHGRMYRVALGNSVVCLRTTRVTGGGFTDHVHTVMVLSLLFLLRKPVGSCSQTRYTCLTSSPSASSHIITIIMIIAISVLKTPKSPRDSQHAAPVVLLASWRDGLCHRLGMSQRLEHHQYAGLRDSCLEVSAHLE